MPSLPLRLVTALLGALGTLELGFAQECSAENQIWDRLSPGTVDSLTWERCYNTRLCAKLQVPLDYNKPNGTQAVVALLKVPAIVSTNDTNYKGVLLFNPGGPGGSGVDAINESGDLIQGLFGEEFDIVGFDPRGVGRTAPAAIVFPTVPERLISQLQESDGPLPFETQDAIARLYDNSFVFGDLALTRGQNYTQFVSTATVARDMLQITRAHGRDKLLYWGISYGSLLGMTYAAMFPDNVERVIVDGVIDTDDYLSGSQSAVLVQTDAGLRAFYQACVDAGPTECTLHESSVDKIGARVDTILNNLKRRPIPVYANETQGTGTYGLVTYKLAQSALFSFLYQPYGTLGATNASVTALALSSLEQGDGSLLWELSGPSQASLACNGTETFPLPPILAGLEAGRVNLCTDTDPLNGTVEDMEAYFNRQRNISQFADMWTLAPQCQGWKVRPVERFRGPFVANTSFPLLFVGNVNDPVLPVQNAVKMSKGFNRSVVLTQNSSGHCSIAASSSCVQTAMRNYMRDGTLPAPGTVCEIESTFFGNPSTTNFTLAKKDEGGVAEAWRGLVSSLSVPKFGGML